MLGLISKLVLSKTFDDYHSLSDNRVESESYEIKKIINGDIYAVMFSRSTRTILVKAARYLWKFNEQGVLLDTYFGASGLHRSGMLYSGNDSKVPLRGDDYVDWVYTGDRRAHPLPDFINAKSMTDAKIHALLDKAEVVEFFYDYKKVSEQEKRLGMALLRIDGKWQALDISKRAEQINTSSCEDYKRRNQDVWKDTCLESYQTTQQRGLEVLQSRLPFKPDWKDASRFIYMQDFSKGSFRFEDGAGMWLLDQTLGRILKSQGVPGGLSETYWLGNGYFELKHQDEKLHFKALMTQESNGFNFDNFAFYSLPEGFSQDVSFIEIMYKGTEHDYYQKDKRVEKEYEPDVGLYVVRKKNQPVIEEKQAAGKSGMVMGQPHTYFSQQPWHPVLNGMSNKDDNWVRLEFFNELESSRHHLLHTAAVTPELHAIPRKMIFNWDDVKRRYAFKLYLSESESISVPMLGDDNNLLLELTFDEAELVAAFGKLDKKKLPMQLVLQLDEVQEVGARLFISLRNEKEALRLERTKIVSVKPEYAGRDKAMLLLKYEKAKLWMDFERASKDKKYLLEFLQAMIEVAEGNQQVLEHGVLLTQQVNQLINIYTTMKDYDAARQVIENYIHKIYPQLIRAGVERSEGGKNLEVIASNSLSVAIILQDTEFQEMILDSLLGKNFDLLALENATLVFNVACYYAVHGQKQKMLSAARRSLQLGKKPEQLKEERDFSAYLEDEDFRQILSGK